MIDDIEPTTGEFDAFVLGLKDRVVRATARDNRRRRTRRRACIGASAAVVASVGVLTVGLLAEGGSMNSGLVPVAQAAEVAAPTWSTMNVWEYSTDTSVIRSRGVNTGAWTLLTKRKQGAQITTSAQVAGDQQVAANTEALAPTFNGIAAGTLPSQTERSSITGSPFPEIDAAANPPTTVAGWQSIAAGVSYGSTCGEKTMVVAADVLSVPGVAPTARRSLVQALGQCADIAVKRSARDPLGRQGTSIAVTGSGSGIQTTTTLTLDQHTGQPLSLVTTATNGVHTTHWQLAAGTVITAEVFRYDNR